MNSVLKDSKQKTSFGSIKRNFMQSKLFSLHHVLSQKIKIKVLKMAKFGLVSLQLKFSTFVDYY